MTLLNIFKRAKEGDYVLMASGLLKPVVASYTNTNTLFVD